MVALLGSGDEIYMYIYVQGSPFKLAGTFDRYYYKKYKTYKNF